MQHADFYRESVGYLTRPCAIWVVNRRSLPGFAENAASRSQFDLKDGLGGMHVLVVEDETMVSMDISMALQDLGARVHETGLLSEAVDLARQDLVDGAILDIDLGGTSVFPAADILHARSIPIVFHTGHGERHNLEQRYPGARICMKPTILADLLATLRDAIEGAD